MLEEHLVEVVGGIKMIEDQASFHGLDLILKGMALVAMDQSFQTAVIMMNASSQI